VDVAVGYSHTLAPGSFIRSLKIKLQIDNALDRKISGDRSIDSKGAPSFTVLPDRNYFLTVSSEF